MSGALPVEFCDIRMAADRLAGTARRTPLIPLPLPGTVALKAESLQATGSFKLRGAFNAICAQLEAAVARGVVADSSGNHAQGVAAAARLLGVSATIVMPRGAPAVKVDRTRALGATIVHSPDSLVERQAVAGEIVARTRSVYVSPFDEPLVIAGQGTVGVEIAADAPDAATVVVPVGGGGLISGIAIALAHLLPGCRVVGVEPAFAADARDSIRRGERVTWSAADVGRTIADGARAQSIGVNPFAIISRLVSDIVAVDDDAILDAVRWAALEAKLILEPTGALALAAVLSGAIAETGRIVVVGTGGNIDPALLAAVMARTEGPSSAQGDARP